MEPPQLSRALRPYDGAYLRRRHRILFLARGTAVRMARAAIGARSLARLARDLSSDRAALLDSLLDPAPPR